MTKRDENGMYRAHVESASERCEKAHKATQTHEGRFTHSRDASERRMPLAVTVPGSVPYFKNRKANRDAYRPRVTK